MSSPGGILSPIAGALGNISNIDSLLAYRPPQWAIQTPPLTIVVPPGVVTSNGLAASVADTISSALGAGNAASSTVYVFDTIWRADHEQDITMTQEPVQTGASITDHFFRMPARLTAEIGMSDAMASYYPGQFSGSPSRSVSAFQTLLAIQASGALLQVATRMRQYTNMLIHTIREEDSVDTRFGARFTVTFQEVILADSTNGSQSGITFSTRPDATGSAVSGQTQTQQVSQVVAAQHNIANAPASVNLGPGEEVAGGGTWSSENISGLGVALAP